MVLMVLETNLFRLLFVVRGGTSWKDPGSMVSCTTYEMCFKKSSIQSMNVCLNGMTHGPVSDRAVHQKSGMALYNCCSCLPRCSL